MYLICLRGGPLPTVTYRTQYGVLPFFSILFIIIIIIICLFLFLHSATDSKHLIKYNIFFSSNHGRCQHSAPGEWWNVLAQRPRHITRRAQGCGQSAPSSDGHGGHLGTTGAQRYLPHTANGRWVFSSRWWTAPSIALRYHCLCVSLFCSPLCYVTNACAAATAALELSLHWDRPPLTCERVSFVSFNMCTLNVFSPFKKVFWVSAFVAAEWICTSSIQSAILSVCRIPIQSTDSTTSNVKNTSDLERRQELAARSALENKSTRSRASSMARRFTAAPSRKPTTCDSSATASWKPSQDPMVVPRDSFLPTRTSSIATRKTTISGGLLWHFLSVCLFLEVIFC